MIKNYLKKLTNKELKELLFEKRGCMYDLYKTCVQLGNKDPENNVFVKAYFEQIEAIKEELKKRGVVI